MNDNKIVAAILTQALVDQPNRNGNKMSQAFQDEQSIIKCYEYIFNCLKN